MTALSVGGSSANEEEKTSHVNECGRGGGGGTKISKMDAL